MKKIMFNKRYGLEQAVLEGWKTMTRRVAYDKPMQYMPHVGMLDGYLILCDGWRKVAKSAYRVGEEIAIAQSYESIYLGFSEPQERHNFGLRVSNVHHTGDLYSIAGWTNKMYVSAELMPERIYITNLKIEQLQDISDEDCMKEGIMEGEFMNTWDRFYYDEWGDVANHITFKKHREAFAALIDKVSRKKVWEKNPWVFAYEFELLK